jgi:hypothetical protein
MRAAGEKRTLPNKGHLGSQNQNQKTWVTAQPLIEALGFLAPLGNSWVKAEPSKGVISTVGVGGPPVRGEPMR